MEISAVKSPGRRSRSRLKTNLSGRITTLNGTQNVQLLDISLTGARLALSDRRGITDHLRSGMDAALEWDRFEAFGTIIWSARDEFGMRFDEGVHPKVLIETRDLHDRQKRTCGDQYENIQSARNWAHGR